MYSFESKNEINKRFEKLEKIIGDNTIRFDDTIKGMILKNLARANDQERELSELKASSASHTERIEANAIINNELLGYYARNYKELSELSNRIKRLESK
ncbi:hypothetical protein LCGC14_2637660 [marine sediment metagenome]|uniref:Uncharacterized protein n=1 Tax=marine sediment metagenome TaxID=412755 RepID=A0A0F8ZYD2_9ZZZZ